MAENTGEKAFLEMSPAEFEAVCRKAVAEREANPQMDYVTCLEKKTGKIVKKYRDGRVEYVL